MSSLKNKKFMLFLIFNLGSLQALTVENCNSQTRLFWDSTSIAKDTFDKFLIMVNKLLELKLENELFVATLRQISYELKRLDTDLESQTILQNRIDALIKAFSNRSQNEINDVAFLRALFGSLGICCTTAS